MRPFPCPVCDTRVYFENTQCTACGTAIGYQAERDRFVAVDGGDYDYCANHPHSGCNWVVPAASAPGYCIACELNEIIPPVEDPEQRRRWAGVEAAKRRFLYSVLRLSIPIHPKRHDPSGLSFRILVNAEHGGSGDVTMGHANGVITIDATEADAHLREFRRAELDESYRTLLGHMRHESGHYFWERLGESDGFLEAFRALFGDEREDYPKALERHYANGAPENWREDYISAYATSHPWEDWAESFAHYLHVLDGAETFEAYAPALTHEQDLDPYSARDLRPTLSRWHSIALMMNAMNRSMGHQDYYPFVINSSVTRKLIFIHEWMFTLRPPQSNLSAKVSP